MMNLSKLLGVAVIVCATLSSGYSADVVLEFRPNDNYFVRCGDGYRLFTNTEELSNGMNDVTSPNFSATSIDKIGNILTFNDVRSGNNGHYKLSLSNSTDLKYQLLCDCSNEKVNFDINCNNIDLLDINSNFSCVLHGLSLNNSNVVLHGKDCHVVTTPQ